MFTLHAPLVLAQEDLRPPSATPVAPPAGEQAVEQVPGGTGDGTGGPAGQTRQPQPGFGNEFFFIMIGLIFLMFIFSLRSQSKEKKKRQALLAGIAKGDRVQTVGGIIGTVVELREHEVVLKIDENNNTRVRITRGAIQSTFQEKDELPKA